MDNNNGSNILMMVSNDNDNNILIMANFNC